MNATLTAPNFSANMLQSTPMGPLASFERPVPTPQPRPAHLTQAATTANLTYGANANTAAVSAHSQAVLADIMATAGVTSATITSTARTPADQARAMYDNLQTQGVARQRELYGRFGDQVIDAYEEAVGAGLSRPEVEQAMVDRINELGPSNVSRHLANPDQLNVVDISPRSIPASQHDAFIAAIRANPSVSNFLGPADGDPAFHIEIRQPQPE
ncbi:hypothetical protein [Pyxidicoccus sp. MSG2]|uniref:hypothetical protein n=1 Tax=Pyxidicoccus sp. MSG2 TaxID=2996790 RepID=UPI00227218AF|nr:hypothetical protein [Pyxidicoccus sp. MSG2]MCY1021234.1 hypothetical protein [Pyxidicoccus sp. MSG2]